MDETRPVIDPEDGTILAIRTIAMPADTNPAGDIFGGWLMSQMDLAAGNVAGRVSRGRAATVAVEGMKFHEPVKVGDEVTLFARLVSRGRTSMRIAVEAWARKRFTDESAQVTAADFYFVALDEAGNKRALPEE
ncbi:acyl-CoA thioesterase [Pseudoponticoccus marisrubri]|uniref:Acyl-CoA thioesterase n=1 Tax=Pseudoponticoccus marisrubri TaxID=1685382 RepID=A0A0W7WI97_9RHOB|nr:acyl-CoA thioesterase [Pseudoponticoccus marisrubri]KUF10200.1 acyl-CoA thioesterase [Pseudoponticoccus marisrubri]